MKKLIVIFSIVISLIIFLSFSFMFFYKIYYNISGLHETEYLFKTKKTRVIIAEGDMMNPTIEDGDTLVFKNVKSEELQKGDIIYFYEENNKRIGKIENIRVDESGEKWYTTKGEQNYYYNSDITKKDIKGKYEKKLGLWANLMVLARGKGFSIFLIILILAILILSQIRMKQREKSEKRKHKRERISRNI